MSRLFLSVLIYVCLHSGALCAFDLDQQGRVSLNSAVQYYEDPNGNVTIAAVREPGLAWQSNQDKAFNQGYSHSAWWLRLNLVNSSGEQLERFLELSYAVLDYVDVYVYSGDQLLRSYQLGDRYPFFNRVVEHRFFVVPLTWNPGQQLDIYYRIRSSTAIQAPLVLKSDSEFHSTEIITHLAQGLYYGAMLIIAVYNLLIFFTLWDRSYLYYVLFVLSLPLFLASISGQAFHFLWPGSVGWNDHAIPFFLGLAFASSALFARRFLAVKSWSRWLYSGLTLIAVAATGCALMSFFVPYRITIHLLVPLGLFACLFEIGVGVLALNKNIYIARYYLVAWLTFLCGGVLLALNKLNILPANFITEYGIQFGSVLEAVLLSLALAARISEERKLRFAAQTEVLQATRNYNEELEEKVAQRTRELEEANSRLQEMSTTDDLTGLKNRRFLEMVLNDEWARSRRENCQLAVLMMDLDEFKAVNDNYGHLVGDEVLRQIASRISNTVHRSSDKVCRFGGEEFCVLLPDTSEDGALAVADRIRNTIGIKPIDVKGKIELPMTVSIGVCVLVPRHDNHPQELIRRADQALYRSKLMGRNRTSLYRESDNWNVTPLPLKKDRPES